MQCFQCGTQFPDGMPNCPNCGAPLNNQFGQGQPGQQSFGGGPQSFGGEQQSFGGGPQSFGPGFGYSGQMTKKEFLHHPNLKKCYDNIKSSAIILYVCAALSLALGIYMGNWSILVDVLIIVGFGLGIQLGQSRICAILIFLYSIANIIYTGVSTGRSGGMLIVLASIYALGATFKFQKAWKEYKKTGILPAPN